MLRRAPVSAPPANQNRCGGVGATFRWRYSQAIPIRILLPWLLPLENTSSIELENTCNKLGLKTSQRTRAPISGSAGASASLHTVLHGDVGVGRAGGAAGRRRLNQDLQRRSRRVVLRDRAAVVGRGGNRDIHWRG